jgi:hypothetical protein
MSWIFGKSEKQKRIEAKQDQDEAENELRLKKLKSIEPFLKKIRPKYITPEIDALIEKTTHLEPIPRYFIIDAVLSHRFTITLEEALDAWQRESEAAQKIHESIQLATITQNIPRIYQCVRFVLELLKHLVFRGYTKSMVNYASGARNFMVGILRSSQCLCYSYTMYVQAFLNQFGYDDRMSECEIPGHMFTMSDAYDMDLPFSISCDTGFYKNGYVLVEIYGASKKYTQDQMKTFLGWDDLYYRLQIMPDDKLPTCSVTSYWGQSTKRNARLAGVLWVETMCKKSFEHMIRNKFILVTILAGLVDVDKDIEKNLPYAKYGLAFDVIERQSLMSFFETDGKLNLKQRQLIYNKVKEMEPLAIQNKQVFWVSYGENDSDLICGRQLISLFYDFIYKKWNSLQEVKPLLDINQNFLELLRTRPDVPSCVISKANRIQFTLSLTLESEQSKWNVPFFSVCIVLCPKIGFVNLNVFTAYDTTVYCNKSVQSQISTVYIKKGVKILYYENMDPSIVIVVNQFPSTMATLKEIEKTHEPVKEAFLLQLQEIANGLYFNEVGKSSNPPNEFSIWSESWNTSCRNISRFYQSVSKLFCSQRSLSNGRLFIPRPKIIRSNRYYTKTK